MSTEVFARAKDLDVLLRIPDGYIIYQTAADRVHCLNNTVAVVLNCVMAIEAPRISYRE